MGACTLNRARRAPRSGKGLFDLGCNDDVTIAGQDPKPTWPSRIEDVDETSLPFSSLDARCPAKRLR